MMKCFCVSLRKRIDRRNQILKDFNKQNLEFEFFDAIEHKSPKRGNALSHQEILKWSNEHKESVMIFEDDAQFLVDDFTYHVEEIKKSLFDVDWSMFYFGATIGKEATNKIERIKHNILKIDSCFASHAYMVNHNYAKKIYDLIVDQNKGCDLSYRASHNKLNNIYLAYPLLCTQRPGYSDLEKRNVNYSRDIVECYKLRVVDGNI